MTGIYFILNKSKRLVYCIGGVHQGFEEGLSPFPQFFPHLWMCIESKLFKKYKKASRKHA